MLFDVKSEWAEEAVLFIEYFKIMWLNWPNITASIEK